MLATPQFFRRFSTIKKRRVRRMTENYASKSALDRGKSLLDDSERFGLPPGPPLSSRVIGDRVEGRSLGRIRQWSFQGSGPGLS